VIRSALSSLEGRIPAETSAFDGEPAHPRFWDVQAQGAAFYVALLKAHFTDEAQEFAEWFLDTFDHDLED
jgi:hypothetical protein